MNEIDTASIRAMYEARPSLLRADVFGLCDALDAARAEIERLRGDLSESDAVGDDAAAERDAAEDRAGKAEAQVAAVRALVAPGSAIRPPWLAGAIREALDGAAPPPAVRAPHVQGEGGGHGDHEPKPQAGTGRGDAAQRGRADVPVVQPAGGDRVATAEGRGVRPTGAGVPVGASGEVRGPDDRTGRVGAGPPPAASGDERTAALFFTAALADQPAAPMHEFVPGQQKRTDYCWAVIGQAVVLGTGKRGGVACGQPASHPIHVPAAGDAAIYPEADRG